MTVKELQAQAQSLGIKNVKKYKKEELIALIAEKSATPATDKPKPINEDDVKLLIQLMSKSEARKFRKELYASGKRKWAAVRRAA